MARKDFAAMEARGTSGDSAARAALRSRIANPTSIRLDELQPNPRNPRYKDADPEVQELAETLSRVGQLQPAIVVTRDQYSRAFPEAVQDLGPEPWVVIVGNRRLAASRLARRSALDVRVDSDLETPEDFEDRVLIENLQRNDLPPLLEAEYLQRRLSRPGQTVRSIGTAIGKSHMYVQQRIDLLRMIPEFQDLLRRGEVNIKTGRMLGTQPEAEQRAILAGGPPFSVTPRRRAADVASTSSADTALAPSHDAADPVADDQHLADRKEDRVGNPSDEAEKTTTESEPDTLSSAPPAATLPAATLPAATLPAATLPAAIPPAENPNPTPHPDTSLHNTARNRPDSADLPSSNGRIDTAHVETLAQTHTVVAQCLDTAISELDRTLPGTETDALSRVLTEARHLIGKARAALDQPALES